jgi:hypothetical protein
MIITPHLGIGDIIILKIKDLSNKLNITQININTELLKTHSDNYENKLYTIREFILFLFPNITIELTEGPCDFYRINEYPFGNTYLYNKIGNKLLKNKNKYNDYIVFHTKMRYDQLIRLFNQEILQSLIIFFETFKTSKKILILGEKRIGQNYETILLETCSLYDHLLLLGKNNTVIDLTNDILTSGNPNFDDFLSDIEIINGAICNITFGIGGPFNICMAFSTRHISILPFYKLSCYANMLQEIDGLNNCIIENVEEISDKIKYYEDMCLI